MNIYHWILAIILFVIIVMSVYMTYRKEQLSKKDMLHKITHQFTLLHMMIILIIICFAIIVWADKQTFFSPGREVYPEFVKKN